MDIKNATSIFFENKGLRQIILKNTFWLTISEIISRGSQLVLVVYLIRIVGAEEYGKFAFALAFVSMLVIIADFGLPPTITREFSQNKENEEEFKSVLSLKILLSIVTFVVMFLISFLITKDPAIQKIIWILSSFVLISNFFLLLYAFLQARQKMEYQALLKGIQSVALIVIGFFVLFNFPSIKNISYGYVLANSIAFVATIIFFHFYVFKLSLSWNLNVIKKILYLSWPVASATIFASLFVNIDSIMLGYFGQLIETGWYNASYRIIGAIIVPAVLIQVSFYPVMSSFFKESKERFLNILNVQLEIMVILALPIMVAGLLLAPKVINFFYGPTFSPAILPFQILIVMVGASFLYGPFYSSFLASNQQKKALMITFIGAVTNIALNLILIPAYSLNGAAIAILASYIVILLLSIEVSRRTASFSILNKNIFIAFLIGIMSTLLMMGVIKFPFVYKMHILSIFVIGATVYLSTIFFFFKKGFGIINIKHWKGQ